MKTSLLLILVSSLIICPALAQSEYSSPRIDIGIVVSDLDRSMEFYQNVMGMKKVNLYDINSDFGLKSGLSGGIPFKAQVLKTDDTPDATEWKLMSFDKAAQHPDQKWIQDDTGMQYATFIVKSLQPFLERIEEYNIRMLGETPTPIDEQRTFILIQDPDGIFIELIGPPLE